MRVSWSVTPMMADVTVVEGQDATVELKFARIASVRQAVTVVGGHVFVANASERIVIRD